MGRGFTPMFLSRRTIKKKYPQPPTRLHFDLNMIALEPFDHPLILLAGVNPVRTGSHGPRPPMPPSSALVIRIRHSFGAVLTA